MPGIVEACAKSVFTLSLLLCLNSGAHKELFSMMPVASAQGLYSSVSPARKQESSMDEDDHQCLHNDVNTPHMAELDGTTMPWSLAVVAGGLLRCSPFDLRLHGISKNSFNGALYDVLWK
ncbi:hypothetical protein ACQJBY_000899 [Aegilops geniculata]